MDVCVCICACMYVMLYIDVPSRLYMKDQKKN